MSNRDNETINGPEDLVGATVGAQLGTTGAMEIEAIADTTLKTYDTYELAFLDLANGQVKLSLRIIPRLWRSSITTLRT